MATQSLYRRYRPRRFAEVKGQDHVVRALRTAVAEGREGQAYLFSGPRGTGKTTSARILAKVLNCEHPVGGEPCCECESCLSVERGTSYDVHELDAASNNGVDSMRDLIEKASLGTPGRHKVYILDEVHMLSKGAEAALLKTLEEPPPHVVFVLATTDPQKMSDTIRSRTQHLQFHLLPADTLVDHARWVADDAGLELSDAALEQAITRGAGSARDTLSALELIASIGDGGLDIVPLDEFVEAMVDRDPGRALTMVAHAISGGLDARTLTESLIGQLRNGFLSLMAPELVQMPTERLDGLADQARRLGAPSLVRGIEVLGAALTEMRHAPDARVLLDVATVQLTADDAAGDVGALAVRLDRLERRVADGAAAPSASAGGAATAAAVASAPVDAETGRAALGGRARTAAASPMAETTAGSVPAGQLVDEQPVASPDDPSAASGRPAVAEEPTAAGVGAAAPVSAGGAAISPETWENDVRPALRGMARAVYAPADFVSSTASSVTLSVPNAVHRGKCEQHRAAVEAALTARVGSAVQVHLVDGDGDGDGSGGGGGPSTRGPSDVARGADAGADPDGATVEPGEQPDEASAAATSPEPVGAAELAADEDVDLDDLVDAPPESVKSPIDRLAEAFPGSELIQETG